MEKRYVSRRWPNLHLPGIKVKFRNGQYATSDESLQKAIESQAGFGSSIVLMGLPAKAGAAVDLDAAVSDLDVPPGEAEGEFNRTGKRKGKIVTGMIGSDV